MRHFEEAADGEDGDEGSSTSPALDKEMMKRIQAFEAEIEAMCAADGESAD